MWQPQPRQQGKFGACSPAGVSPYPLYAVLQPQLPPHGLLLLEELLERLRERRRRRDLRAQARGESRTSVRHSLAAACPPKRVLDTEGAGTTHGVSVGTLEKLCQGQGPAMLRFNEGEGLARGAQYWEQSSAGTTRA